MGYKYINFFTNEFNEGSALNGIPFFSDALFTLDGIIIDIEGVKYFRDKTSNARNFIINDYDFNDNWLAGFPYKSAATISAPAGDTALIAADINNYLYDANGDPNQIPVVSLFQDIDYEHKLFCRHYDQVLDQNGVETDEPRVFDITMYNTVKADALLTTCQNYYNVPVEDLTAKWVTLLGNDITGDGTKENPYASVTKAVTVTSDGKTIYVKSENPQTMVTYNYLRDYTANKLRFIGFNKFVSTDATYLARFGNNVTLECKGIVLSTAVTPSPNFDFNASPIVFSKNFVENYKGLTGSATEVSNNIFKNANNASFAALKLSATSSNLLVSSNLFLSDGVLADIFIFAATYNVSIINNKSNGSLRADSGTNIHIEKTITGNVLIRGNYIRNKNGNAVRINCNTIGNKATSDYVLDISYNNFIVDFTDYKAIEVMEHQINVPHIHHNAIIYNVGSRVVCISFHAGNILAENNIISCPVIIDSVNGEHDFDGESLADEIIAESISQTINNNRVKSRRETDGHININYTVFTSPSNADNKINAVITNNFIQGIGAFNELITGSAYGCGVGNQINAAIKFNRFESMFVGVAIGGNYTFTANGVWSNIIKDCLKGVYVHGMDAINIVNNTIVSKHAAAIGFEFYTGASLNVVKNNIVILNGTGNCYGAKVVQTDNVFDYNIYYCPNGTLKFAVNGVDKTFAEWQALDYDTNSIVLTSEQYTALFNYDYSLKTGSVAIGNGVNLGTDYDDGLDSSTQWNDELIVPTVVTKQQGASWDTGAYVS